jgi:hypothetical protein
VKRLLVVTVAVFAMLLGIGVTLLFVGYAQRQKRIEAIRAAGNPVTIADLQPQGVNVTNNAMVPLGNSVKEANDFQHAAASLLEREGEIPPEDLQAADALMARYQGLLQKLDQAAKCKRWVWDWDYSLPPNEFMEVVMEQVGQARSFARANECRVRYLIATDRPAEAVAICLDQLRCCAAQQDMPFIIGFLTSNGCRSGSFDGLNRLLQEEKLTPQSHDAIETELSLHDVDQHFMSALQSERALGISMLQQQAGFLLAATGELDAYLDVMEQELAAGPVEQYQIAANPPVAPVGIGLTIAPALAGSRNSLDRTRTMIRCLRILNAIKRRDSSEPVTGLTGLGLPADVTLDPYTGRPLMSLQTATGWLIYSVGPDQVDNQGTFADGSDIGIGARPASIDSTAP